MPRRYKLGLGLLVGYLALPFDLVPDFIPVAGQLDDAVVAATTPRVVLRGGGPDLLREHWPGPSGSLAVVLRLVGYPAAPLDASDGAEADPQRPRSDSAAMPPRARR